jgi:hypothetical protein
MGDEHLRIFARAFLCPSEAPIEETKRRFADLNPRSLVQAVRRTSAGNELFVELLSAQTLQAESSGGLLAKKPEIDFLLRLAGTTQISRAIKQAGAKPGEGYILVVAGRREICLPSQLCGTELQRRELTDSERRKVERAALLNAQRA